MKKITKLGFALCMVFLLMPIMSVNASGKSIEDYFSRPETAQAVGRELKKNENITENDLRTVKQLSLYESDGYDFFDTDLEQLENLESLSLSNTGWTSLEGIGGLQNSLKSLSLANLLIEDIAPLEELENLQTLTFTEQSTVTHNAIATNGDFLAPIENLNLLTLTSLFAPFNDEHLHSISHIESLTNLTLKHSMITSIEPIANLTNLKALNLSDSQLTDLRGVESMHNLSTLNVGVGDRGRERNQITDFSALMYPYSETGVRRRLYVDGLTPMLTMTYDAENDVYYLDLDSIIPPTASPGYEPLKLKDYHIPYYATFDGDSRVVYDKDHVEEIIDSGYIDFSAGNFLFVSKDGTYDAEGIMWTRINSVDLPEPTYHTVSFNSNGGSDVASQQVLDQGNASEPSVPTREGDTFEGWFVDPSLTQSFDFATAIDADTTLYAKWHKSEVYHTVSFKSNGGSDVASQQVLDQGNASEPSVPTREGHTFEGWFVDPSLTQSFDFATAIDANTTLYAKWDKTSTEITEQPGDSDHDDDKPGIGFDNEDEVIVEEILPQTGLNQSSNVILATLVILSGLLTLFVSIKGKEHKDS